MTSKFYDTMVENEVPFVPNGDKVQEVSFVKTVIWLESLRSLRLC